MSDLDEDVEDILPTRKRRNYHEIENLTSDELENKITNVPFSDDQWIFAPPTPANEDPVEVASDEGDMLDDFEHLLNLNGTSRINDTTQIWDTNYCYLCHISASTQDDNEYRNAILKIIDRRDFVNPYFLANSVADYYKQHLFPYTQKVWDAKGVERHLSQCLVDEGIALSDDFRTLSKYKRELTKRAIQVDEEGNEKIDTNNAKLLFQVISERRKQILAIAQHKRMKRQ